MNRTHIFTVLAVVLLLAGLVYFYGGSQTPAGQPPLRSLTTANVAGVKSAFNAAKDDVRVLLLLSPT